MVTESIQAGSITEFEEKLRQEHDINVTLLKSARCIILYLDLDARIVNFNPYFEEITGHRLDDIKGMNWFEVCIPEPDRPRIGILFDSAVAGINTDGTINAILTADGGQRTIIWSNTGITGKDGDLNGLLCCGQDITDRVFAQDHLLIRTQQLVSLSEIAKQALREPRFHRFIEFILEYIINSMGANKVAYIELAETRNLNQIYSGSKTRHLSYHQLTLPVIPDSIAMQALTLNHTVTVSGFNTDDRYRKITELDEQQFSSAIAEPIASSESAIGAICVYHEVEHQFTDEEISYLQSVANIISIVVERNRTQSRSILLSQEILKLSRINLVGVLGTHIAHEINQPLTALMNYLQSSKRLIQSRFGTLPESIETIMEKSLIEAERAAAIIRNIRDYIESGQLHRASEDLNQVIEEICEYIAPELTKKHIILELDLQQDIPPVKMDKLQIQQVLINIIHNSIEAMASSTNKRITISSLRNSANTVMVAIQDTGYGVKPELLDTEFKITLNPRKDGLGLGLSICKSIIDAHNGTCWFSAEQREGAIFNFSLTVNEP